MSKYLNIRQTAKELDFPETRIRLMVKCGECPGIYSGNRFLVNVGALVEMLDQQSRRAVKANV